MKSFELKGNQWFLNGDITFKEILSVHEQAQSYAWKDSVVLNLKGVEELDTSLLSFILEQRRQAKKFGKVLTGSKSTTKLNIAVKALWHRAIYLVRTTFYPHLLLYLKI